MFWLVDIFKFIFSLAIVALHSWFLGQYRSWLYPVFYYSAVPYFFIASGFFFAKKYYTQGYSKDIYRNFCKRLFNKLLVFEPISQIQVIIILALAATPVTTIVIDTLQHIVFYPFGALWYIQAIIVAGFLLVPFIKYDKEKYIIPLGFVLFSFALICGRYYFIIENVPSIKNIVDGYLRYCISPKNGLFIGFLYVGLGVVAAKNWNSTTHKFKFKNLNMLLVINTILFLMELCLIHKYEGLEDGQYYLMQPLFVGSIFLYSAQFYETPNTNPRHNTKLLRNLSISIYLLHAPVQRCFTLFSDITGIHLVILGNPYSLFILTLVCTLLIIYPIYRNRSKYLYGCLT